MNYKPNTTYYTEFVTQNFSTGNVLSADSLPVATVNRNGADDGSFVLTCNVIDNGRYLLSGTVPSTYSNNDIVNISVAATVNSVSGKGIVDQFQVWNYFPTDNYTLASNPVTVSAYTNFPNVQVSGINVGVINTIQSGLAQTNDLTNVSAGIINHGDNSWAVSGDIGMVSAGALLAILDQFTFSGNAVLSVGVSAHINAQEVVDAMLSTVIDTQTFENVITKLLSMAQGKIVRVNNNFTYMQSDGITPAYILQSNKNERDRIG